MKKSRKLAWGVLVIALAPGCAHVPSERRDEPNHLLHYETSPPNDLLHYETSPDNLLRLEEPSIRDLGEDMQVLRLFTGGWPFWRGMIRVQFTEDGALSSPSEIG